MPVCPRVQERKQEEKSDHHPRNHHRRNRLERAGEVLQKLEQTQEVPFRPGHIRGVRWVRDGVQRGPEEDRGGQQQPEYGSADDRVLERVVGIKRLRWPLDVFQGAGDAVPAHQVQMRDNEQDQRRRQQEDVRRIPPQQRERAERLATHQHAGDELAERAVARDVDRHGRRPVRLLVPRQQIAAQRETQNDQQQGYARNPRHFAWLLVRAERDDPHHMDNGSNDDEAGAEKVQPAQKRPEDRKSTRLNSSHSQISYAVFCLKKKKKTKKKNTQKKQRKKKYKHKN